MFQVQLRCIDARWIWVARGYVSLWQTIPLVDLIDARVIEQLERQVYPDTCLSHSNPQTSVPSPGKAGRK